MLTLISQAMVIYFIFLGGDLVPEIPGDKWKNGLNLYEDANSWLVFKKW